MIELRMQPERDGMTWEEFKAMAEPFGVAIDGFVREPPRYDASLPLLNLNHHEGSPRLQTRATCAQALIAIRQGMFQRFRDSGGAARAIVYANDCDEDVCMTWFILKHSYLSEGIINPTLNRLVHMADMDTTAGAYPFPLDLPSLSDGPLPRLQAARRSPTQKRGRVYLRRELR